MSRRTERLASIIRHELMDVIMRRLNDPRLEGFPSITRVRVAEDLSVAQVFITVMGTEGQQRAALAALRHSAGRMRTALTKVLTVRTVPHLQFELDEQLRKELALMELLEQVRRENQELDSSRAPSPPAEQANGPLAQEP